MKVNTHVQAAFAGLALALIGTAGLAAPSAQADREIRHLVDFVAASDCTFIRNGDAHDAKSAAEHLSMKYGKARSRLATPEQFIEHVASRSFFTGREYRVQCPGKTATTSAAWLTGELTAWRQGNRATVTAAR